MKPLFRPTVFRRCMRCLVKLKRRVEKRLMKRLFHLSMLQIRIETSFFQIGSDIWMLRLAEEVAEIDVLDRIDHAVRKAVRSVRMGSRNSNKLSYTLRASFAW